MQFFLERTNFYLFLQSAENERQDEKSKRLEEIIQSGVPTLHLGRESHFYLLVSLKSNDINFFFFF